VRDRVREFIQTMIEGELDAALMRPRYGRRSQWSSGDADGPVGVTGHRHGHRSRSLMGTFGRRTWVERPPRLGVPFSMIWSVAAYVVLPSSSWTARRGWKGNRRGLGRRAGSEVYGP
jgi:hypothetical protein